MPHPHPGWGGHPPPTSATLSEPGAQPSNDFVPNLLTRLRAFFAGDAVDFADVELDLSEYTPFHRACAEVMRGVRAGKASPTASSRRSRAGRGPRAQPARSAPATAT